VRRLYLVAALSALAFIAMPASAIALPVEQLSPASASLARCVQSNGKLSVLMLIDESGSLRQTDPFNQRLDGIRAALTGLADLSDTPVDGRQPEVSVLMAGFFGLVHPNPKLEDVSGLWKPVTHSDVDQLLEEAARYEDLNHGRATDYVTALTAAREALASRAAEETEGGGAPCQALIWFTDGRYALPQRVGKHGVGLPLHLFYAPGISLDEAGAGERAVAAGKQYMCRPNGLMDHLQQDGVIRFTVALSTELAPEDAAFLDAATTGSGAGQRCGAHLSPLSGEYLNARNGDRLFFAFASLIDPIPPVHVNQICPGTISCVRGITTFETVPGLSRFLIRASGGPERSGEGPQALNLRLEGPGGDAVTLKPGGPGEVSVAGTVISQRWISERIVEVQGDFPTHSRSWLGRWSYSFIDPTSSPQQPPGSSFSAVQLFADLEPAVVEDPILIRGEPTRLQFQLVRGSDPDTPVSTGPLVRSAHVIATIDDPVAGTSTRVPVQGPKPDGTFTTTVKMPSDSTAGFAYLGLTATFSSEGGTPIAPQYRSFDLPVRFPPGQGFPTISPASLDLPSLRGDGAVEGRFTVRGSSVSAGCVWVGAPKVTAPAAAGKVEATVSPTAGSADDCLRVGKGQERQFTLELAPSSAASGTVTAALPVHLSSDLVDTDRAVTVPVTFSMAPAPNISRKIFVLVALILLGVLLPLLLLYLLNRRGAYFPAPNRLRVVELSVEMTRGGPLRRAGEEGDPRPELGRGESLASLGSYPVRELKLGEVEFETVAGGSRQDRTFVLFRGPYGVARSGGRRLLAGSDHPLRSLQGGSAHEVALGLAGTWIFRMDGLRPAGFQESWLTGGEPRPEPSGDPVAGSRGWRTAPALEPEPAPPKRRGATIEGRLILLITDGPPVDQAEKLFDAAEGGLREAEDLWQTPQSPEADPPQGSDGNGEATVEAPPSPSPPPAPASASEPQATDWKSRPATEWKPKRGPDKGRNW
jgi:hypothetical protein